MPLRYKKFILIFTLAVMFIGLGTFSLMAPDLNFSLSATKSDEQNIADAIKGKSDKDIKEEITDLVKEYFDARQKVDMDALADCVTDVDNIDERKLVAAAEYIEKYENISCTIKEGYETGSYRVYAYHEDKLYDIDTKIPSLTALYIKMQPDGRFMLHFGTLSGKEQKKIEKLDASKDVKALQDSVNKKLEELQSTNQEVRDFCNMLNESSGDGPESTANIDGEAGSANGATPVPTAPAATQAPAAAVPIPCICAGLTLPMTPPSRPWRCWTRKRRSSPILRPSSRTPIPIPWRSPTPPVRSS